jgi:hypothetical protein
VQATAIVANNPMNSRIFVNRNIVSSFETNGEFEIFAKRNFGVNS